MVGRCRYWSVVGLCRYWSVLVGVRRYTAGLYGGIQQVYSRCTAGVRQVYAGVHHWQSRSPRSRPWAPSEAVAEGLFRQSVSVIPWPAKARVSRCRCLEHQPETSRRTNRYTINPSAGLRLAYVGHMLLAQAHHNMLCRRKAPPPRQPTDRCTPVHRSCTPWLPYGTL